MNFMDNRALAKQVAVILSLLALICLMLVFRFTTKTEVERERARALAMLETIHKLQETYFHDFGTYLSSSRGNTSDVLRWENTPGLFEYIVIDHGDTYVALAEADLDGDGHLEIWRVDPKHAEPVLVQED